jgi:hypothetical protein
MATLRATMRWHAEENSAMKTPLITALLLSAASFAGVALAQTETMPADPAPVLAPPLVATDAQSHASAQEVGVTRRAYRAACERHESRGFCECVTAGMAQVLAPAEMRVAARTISERIDAQGDAAPASDTDTAPAGSSSHERIEHTEAHYANVCAQFRG